MSDLSETVVPLGHEEEALMRLLEMLTGDMQGVSATEERKITSARDANRNIEKAADCPSSSTTEC